MFERLLPSRRRTVRHQLKTSTRPDRYPRVFARLRDAFGAEAELRILSFGCSTGEECTSLARTFPRATIVGADLDAEVLRRARKENAGPGIRYLESRPEVLAAEAPFDLVLAMSVLCRWPELRDASDSSSVYPFDAFEAALGLLDGLLRPSGLLVVHNASYRLEDTDLAGGYSAEAALNADLDEEIVRKFSRTHALLSSGVASGQIYRKR
jgi:SAM-dependent methyltransferase